MHCGRRAACNISLSLRGSVLVAARPARSALPPCPFPAAPWFPALEQRNTVPRSTSCAFCWCAEALCREPFGRRAAWGTVVACRLLSSLRSPGLRCRPAWPNMGNCSCSLFLDRYIRRMLPAAFAAAAEPRSRASLSLFRSPRHLCGLPLAKSRPPRPASSDLIRDL